MGNDREFKIKITTTADTSGAKEQKDALDSLSPKTQQYAQKLKESATEADNAEVSHRNLRFGMHMLGSEAAEAGHILLSSFANPATAAFLAMSLILKGLVQHFEKVNEALAARVDLSGMREAIEALGDKGLLKALTDGETAADDFWDKIARLASEQATLKEKTDDATAALREQADLEKKEMAAAEKSDIEMIEAQRKAGQIDELEAERRKQRTKEKYQAGKDAAGADLEKAEIEAKKKEREGQERVISEGREDVGAKGSMANRAKGELDGAKASLEEWKKKAEEIAKWFKEHGPMASPEAYREQQMAQTLAFKQIARLEQQTVPESEGRSHRADADLAEAQKRVEDAVRRKNELDREIPRAEASAGRNARSRSTVGSIESFGGLMPAIEAEEGRAQGQQMSRATARIVQGLVAQLRAAGNSQERISQLIKEMMDLHVSHDRKLADLQNALKQAKAQMTSVLNNPT
jgi:hypothetical protein